MAAAGHECACGETAVSVQVAVGLAEAWSHTMWRSRAMEVHTTFCLKLLLHKGKSGARYSSPLLPYFCVFQQFWREKKTSCKLVFCSTKYKCKSIHVGLSVSIIRTPTVRSDLSTYSSVLKTQGMLSYVLKSEGIVAIFSCKGKVFSIAIYACIPQTF